MLQGSYLFHLPLFILQARSVMLITELELYTILAKIDIFGVIINFTIKRWYVKLEGHEFTFKKKKGIESDHLDMNI